MRKLLAALFLLTTSSIAFTQSGRMPTVSPKLKADLPCKIADYRIPNNHTLYLYCSGARISEGPKTGADQDDTLLLVDLEDSGDSALKVEHVVTDARLAEFAEVG